MRSETFGPFKLLALYSQVAILDGDSDKLLNDWTPHHIRQGFSWRRGVVAFGTLESGPLDVRVHVGQDPELNPAARRAIRVPFCVGTRGRVQVAVMTEAFEIELSPGPYALIFEHGANPAHKKMWCTFWFSHAEFVTPEILIADKQMSPSRPLIMEAEPA